MPAEPEAKGMLALMLYAEARRPARRDPAGAYVPLDRQDTALWDREQLGFAEQLLRQASAGGPSGRYQIEAAIQSAHTARRLTGADTWAAIVALYTHLEGLTHSPVVTLNRAVALAETEGANAALALLDTLAPDQRMQDYQPYWAARGHLLARLGRKDEAYTALTLAIGLATDNAVRHYLQQQVARLADA
jgi:RNA polymerase sigma-70 factor (ECF subfamily)